MPRKTKAQRQAEAEANLDVLLARYRAEQAREYQRALHDPATLQAAMAQVRALLALETEWSGFMVSRLHLEVMLNALEERAGTVMTLDQLAHALDDTGEPQ